MVLDFVDKVVRRPHIGFAAAETEECAACDGLSHRGLANDEDIFGNGFIPNA